MSFITDINLQIGGHISFSKQVKPTIVKSYENDMNAVQFFLGNPKSFTRQRLTEDDVKKTRELTDKFSTKVFSHYPYTSSLVGSVAQIAWGGNKEQDAKTNKIVKELEYELNTLAKLSKTNGVVIHSGSFKDIPRGLETIAKSINKINFSENANLLLENSAGEGTKLYRNFKEASTILEGVDITKKQNISLCVDTAHTHGSGVYDLKKRDEVDKMFFEFDKFIGLEKFKLLHLNDSMVEFGTKKDRHENIKYGKIWKDDDTALKYLLTKCAELNIPIILETPNVIQDLETISNL